VPIDNSAELKIPEKKSSLGDQIRSILNHRTRQNPSETFHQLAELPSDQPSENQLSLTTAEIVPSSPHPPSNPDQLEITRLSNEIKQESGEIITPETSTNNSHLFPNRPSLDELIAQDPNRKTKVSFLTRQKDIQTLKKSGVADTSQVYDSLVKRGVPRGLILETKGQIIDYGQYRLYMKHFSSYEEELKTKEGKKTRQQDIKALQQERVINAAQVYDGLRSRGISRAQIMENDDHSSSRLGDKKLDSYIYVDSSIIKGIDRLDSLGEFESKSFNSDDAFKQLFTNAGFVSHSPDSVFAETKNKLTQYTFLPIPQTISYFLSSDGLSSESITALDYLKNNFFYNSSNEKKLTEVLSISDYHYDRRPDFAVFVNSNHNYRHLFPLISSIAISDINNQERIEFPSEILSFAKEEEIDQINCLLNLTDRQQQAFFCKNIIDFYPRESFIKKYFDENHQPNLEFYKHYLSHSETISQKVTIPQNLLDSISDQTTKDFYQFLSNLQDGQIQHYILAYADKRSLSPSSFFYEGKLTYQPQHLFRDILLQKNIINNPLKIDQIKDLITSESDQRDILAASRISEATAREFFLYQYPEERVKFLDQNNEFTPYFYKKYAQTYPENFIKYHDRHSWVLVFGQETISGLLNSLPTSTDEKRNAFTHNEYDRTSKFFEFLVTDKNSGFQLNQEHLKIATEYIKNFGLAKSAKFYQYFQVLYLYEKENTPQLPEELLQSGIFSIEDLRREVKKIQKICFSPEPLTDLSNLTPFQIESLSIATGHSVNRFTRIPIQTIISDFSQNLSNGEINPLPSEFYPEIISTNSIKVETDKKISDSQPLTVLSEEILKAIVDGNDISSEKSILIEMFNQRASRLSSSDSGGNSKKQEYLQKQINAFIQEIELISSSDSVDGLLSKLIPFTLGLGADQEKYNSILRQLVFKKVFDKHQNSPGWKENIKNSLESNNTPVAVSQMTDLINNTIKDHVLNFETKNQDGYWSESTFEVVKKYSTPFKKNLSFQSFINELNSYRESFVVIQLGQNQTTAIIPDRGLIGEMSGYMADVCYTKVYPLLKTYPDLVPYKFVANSKSENPEFIGSTLVFKVEDADNQPVFLIRAFDIPNEQSVDIGKFFESFIDHLAPIAKNMGIKKIITAGTQGTISNYSVTNNYVISRYVRDQKNIPLKETFNFNGYDITHQCYLVRDIS